MILLGFLERFLELLLQILTAAVFARAIISWFPIRPDNPLVIILNQITEPILAPLRRVIPTIGMMDISPLVAMILLQVISQYVPVLFLFLYRLV